MKIFLIGMMGVGKTTIGKSLAKHLSLDFVDLDRFIERMYGQSIETLFEKYGEKGFRQKEREALLKVIQERESIVVATGGGTPCFFNNMALMKRAGCVIWLDASPQSIFKRIKKLRPLLNESKDPYIAFLNLYKKRKGFYKQAHAVYQVPPFPKRELTKIVTELSPLLSKCLSEKT